MAIIIHLENFFNGQYMNYGKNHIHLNTTQENENALSFEVKQKNRSKR